MVFILTTGHNFYFVAMPQQLDIHLLKLRNLDITVGVESASVDRGLVCLLLSYGVWVFVDGFL